MADTSEAEGDLTAEEQSTPFHAQELERPELGHLARWAVSSHKYGFGVENLQDGNEGTFWQSEGPQPHTIDLSFPKRVFVSSVALYTSHPRDDSYTPSKISIRAGTGVHDLQEVMFREFNKPDGWLLIPLRPLDSSAQGQQTEGPPIPCHHLRILIIANHLNGKDTHVRGLKIFGAPSQLSANGAASPLGLHSAGSTPSRDRNLAGRRLVQLGHDGQSLFTSPAFKQHERIR